MAVGNECRCATGHGVCRVSAAPNAAHQGMHKTSTCFPGSMPGSMLAYLELPAVAFCWPIWLSKLLYAAGCLLCVHPQNISSAEVHQCFKHLQAYVMDVMLAM
jgi:hypothetical protein